MVESNATTRFRCQNALVVIPLDFVAGVGVSLGKTNHRKYNPSYKLGPPEGLSESHRRNTMSNQPDSTSLTLSPSSS